MRTVDALRGTILRTRGGQTTTAVLASLEQMSEEEAHQWLMILRNVEDEAKSDGVKQGARQPWRR